MVSVNFIGRIGNNLFQYALGRIVAEKLGYQMSCKPLSTSCVNPGASGISKIFPDLPISLAGVRYEEPIEAYRGQRIDLPTVLSSASNSRKISLEGFFQRYEYYADHEEKIRKWFTVDGATEPFEIGARDVVINLRRDLDFGLQDWILPLRYYETILSGMQNIGRVFVCGTSSDAASQTFFHGYKPRYYSGGPLEQFRFLTRFKRIILSNSTFAWWAAYLSEASEIYAPATRKESLYAFRGYREVDLHMKQERYIEVEVATTDKLVLSVMSHDKGIIAKILGENPMLLDRSPREDARCCAEWLSRQSSLTVTEFRDHCPNLKAVRTLSTLLDAGLMRAEPLILVY